MSYSLSKAWRPLCGRCDARDCQTAAGRIQTGLAALLGLLASRETRRGRSPYMHAYTAVSVGFQTVPHELSRLPEPQLAQRMCAYQTCMCV
jgi:hypothetical protein